MPGITLTVMVSFPSGMPTELEFWRCGARHLGEFEHRLDVDRATERQGRGADRETGMLAAVAENLKHQFRSAVDHLRMIVEVRAAIDEAAQLQAARDLVEIAAASRRGLGQD